MDDNGLSDPYVIVQVGVRKMKTKTIRESLNPSWAVGPKGEIFTFGHSTFSKVNEIIIKCMDWDRFSVDDRMGMVTIPIRDLLDHRIHDEWYKLDPQKPSDAVSGELHLRVQIRPKTKKVKKEKHSELWESIKNSNYVVFKEALARHLDWGEASTNGVSLLHLAANRESFTAEQEQILLNLVEHEKSDINLVDEEGNTPLHTFCKNYKNPKCEDLILLYVRKGADVNAKNISGETPLHYAVFNPSLKVIMAECLLKCGAIPDIQNCQGDTPVHYSVNIGRTDLIKLFASYNANFELSGSKGCVPLVMAKGNKTVHDCIRDSLELSRWMKTNGFAQYIPIFLDQELFLYLLSDLEPDALISVVPDKTVRNQIIERSKDIRILDRKETFARKQSLFQKREHMRRKESNLRSSLVQSIQDPTIHSAPGKTQRWEIDINELEFVKCLGKGASGEVFKGLWCGKTIAIKVLTSNNDTKELEEFIREFSVMINVQSPYIVQFYGASLAEKLTMVMEFCERGSLFDVLKNPECPIGWERAFQMLEEITSGIQVLHDHKPAIMHRDLKTLNILVAHDYSCRVADFGLSRFNVSTNVVTLKKCRGTYAYIAPEVYSGKGFIPQSDVYSISIMFWEFVTRILKGEYEKPFSEYKHIRMDIQILVQAAKNNLRPTVKEGTPASLAQLIKDCWQVEQTKRPVTGELLSRLREIRAEYNANKTQWDTLAAPMKPVQPKTKKIKNK
eukprot:TRINITY_DN3434_c0_g1_i2.p1 TRINITY_DN3434_c0_g1~~TRINITY_DN3434_c0_g1_i2.p1  ORF type:complete len:772 (-),score=154.55 TRINITY_DN3434_c0_g1_i2:123-2318(-)